MRRLSEKAEAVRVAFGAEEYERATQLWTAYAAELERAVRSGTATSEAIAEAEALLEWSRATARQLCAHGLARLRETSVARRYAQPGAREHALVRALL